jgi:superfamily I DNA/RNA helicase
MSPYEAARLEAAELRRELSALGINLDQAGPALVEAACKQLGVALRSVKPEYPLLKGADATIFVQRKMALVRNDVSDEIKAFLIAHELGHLRLHPAVEEAIPVSQSVLSGESESNGASAVEAYGVRERQELQANLFAREFLLPRALARELFLQEALGPQRIASDRTLPLELLPHIAKPAKVFSLPPEPTPAQGPAVDSDASVSLVEAGPGTGKTTALLLRLRRLIASGEAPEGIVILTFSNKAARELVERARAGNIPGADRVWIGTFHAFGLEFLRKFGALIGLGPRFPVLDKMAALAMLEEEVPESDLQFHDPLSNPSWWLAAIVDAIRRSKDEFFDAAKFDAAVRDSLTQVDETNAKMRDAASIFRRYEELLRARGAVDLTDLLCVTIRLLQSGDPAVERFLGTIRHLMVDEYQDVNRASALLVKSLSMACETLWVVGDANQAIYAFMGASSSNLEHFQQDFPGAVPIPLALNHRSSQEIVDAFGLVASRNPAGRASTVLRAERGAIGHGPRHILTSGDTEQASALAWRIRELQKQGVPLSEQAVITYKNAVAADVAQSLESLGIPVLFLGNIFERPEIKDLICLLQLATDREGSNLLRSWHLPCLGLSRAGADTILRQVEEQKAAWHGVTGEGLDDRDGAAWQNLRRLCGLVEATSSPWDALTAILLEDGQWLRELASSVDQSQVNALMAVWQFIYFCRTPSGTGRWATVKSLPERIRDRLRHGEDRAMRAVPPEAEGLDAVRILTAHGSKGLEFDAVHFVEVTASTYEPVKKPNARPHIPSAVLDDSKVKDIHRNERHNLLYVGMSRPRKFLTAYSTREEKLPTALEGVLSALDGDWARAAAEQSTPPKDADGQTVSLKDFLEYKGCAKRSELSGRGGKWQKEDLKLHRAVGLATSHAMKKMKAEGTYLLDQRWQECAEDGLAQFRLQEHTSIANIRARVHEQVRRGRDWLSQGGELGGEVLVAIGPLKVVLRPEQVLKNNGKTTLRFIVPDEKAYDRLKQPLGVMLAAHNKLASEALDIEIATLSDGILRAPSTIRKETPSKYEAVAFSLCAGDYSGIPDDGRACHSCPYLFACSKRPAEDE